jgi:Phage integrase SAM-like domain
MGRETSPYIVGDYWLDKRRDGKSPDVWQIARYVPGTRSIIYKSTKCRTIEAAKPIIHAYDAQSRALAFQPNTDAKVIPQLILYIKEKEAANAIVNIAQSKSSMRAFIGFLMQDDITVDATFADLKKAVWKRFMAWRKGPHSYSVLWGNKEFNHTSQGVSGETIQRNLDDVRAALNHAEEEERVGAAPRVTTVDKRDRSKPRDTRLTVRQMGAIVGYASQHSPGAKRWVLHMIATAGRPDAALQFDPATQIDGQLIDLHPAAWRETDKMNPVVPMIQPMKPVYDEWLACPHVPVKSRKTWWRQMRKLLGFDNKVIPKTIRHTIGTMLRSMSVPGSQISGLMGHDDPEMKRTTGVYAKYDPQYLGKAKRALTNIFEKVLVEADKWNADHLLTKETRAKGRFVPAKIEKRRHEAALSIPSDGGR